MNRYLSVSRCIYWALLLQLLALVVPKDAHAFSVVYSGHSSRIEQSLHFEAPTLDGTKLQVLNGFTSMSAAQIKQRVNDGEKIFLILSPDSRPTDLKELFDLVSLPSLQRTDAGPQVTDAASQLPLGKTLNWRSAPQLHCWFKLPAGNYQTLVERRDGNEPLLLKRQLGPGTLLVFVGCLNEFENVEFQDWAYFHYFIHTSLAYLYGTNPEPFSEYQGAQVPRGGLRTMVLLLFVLAIPLSFLGFAFVRRYSLRNPQILVACADASLKTQARNQTSQWSQAGFHRPLGGFLLALIAGLLLFIPFVVFNNLVMPRYVLPSAQALGIWARVVQFFAVFWLFFDWGTGTAFVKYLSEYRRSNPARALQFGQVFVWWQILTGTVQALLFVVLAMFVAPQTAFAIYAWAIISHTIIQIPGFFQVTRMALVGVQRYDFAQIVDIMGNMVLPMLVQPLIVYYAYQWGVAHPDVGGAFAGVIGMAASAYLLEFLRFALGHYLYRRAGYHLRIFFFAHFDRSVLKECLRFGSFEMLGGLAWSAGQALEIHITEAKLANYTEVWGNWTLAQNFALAFAVQLTLYGNLLPSLSESTSAGLKALSQYYQSQGYKWGAFVTSFLIAVLVVVAPRFILGSSGEQFTRAATWSIPAVLAGAFLFPSWAGDHIALGSGKPWIKPVMVFVEQSMRITGVWFLIARFQVNALIIAYVFGFIAKAIGIYVLNNKVCFKHRFYLWQGLVAPILAGLAHFLCLRLLAELIWVPTPFSSVLLFFVGILLSFPLYVAFFSWFGGWDDATLGELRDAAEASGPMRALSLLLWRVSRFAASRSPLHNRFPMDNRAAAMVEAATLSQST